MLEQETVSTQDPPVHLGEPYIHIPTRLREVIRVGKRNRFGVNAASESRNRPGRRAAPVGSKADKWQIRAHASRQLASTAQRPTDRRLCNLGGGVLQTFGPQLLRYWRQPQKLGHLGSKPINLGSSGL